MEKNNKNKNILHGNKAVINPAKNIIPRFSNYIVNDFKSMNGEVVNRLDDHAEFCRKEADNNKK